MKMVSKKKFITIFIILALMISFTFVGCGSKSDGYYEENSTAENKMDMAEEGFGGEFNQSVKSKEAADKSSNPESVENTLDTGRKIIKNYYVSLETKNFEDTNNKIVMKVESIGGYVESSHVSGRRILEGYDYEKRNASYILRIPKEKSDSFINDLGDIGNVLNERQDSQEITAEYFDSEAHLKALKIQEERLLELLQKSGELSDILQIEKELSNVRYQIESLTGTLRKWDNLIDYCTISIDVDEVTELSEESPTDFINQIKQGFINSLNTLYKLIRHMIIVLVVMIPYIIVVLLVAFIILKVRKKVKTIKENKNNNKHKD
ncbi:hypothetical protein SH2C18_34000 [Clostridium sediminicola]|uniref:DUF4349 domain-containing protein n=1 Tax=Clostridium sediminicola TaxID=3114879 RepID=UPI0031F2300D